MSEQSLEMKKAKSMDSGQEVSASQILDKTTLSTDSAVKIYGKRRVVDNVSVNVNC